VSLAVVVIYYLIEKSKANDSSFANKWNWI